MGFVDDDGEGAVRFAGDLVEDKREFLDRGNDDLAAFGDVAAEVARATGVADGGSDLHELLYGALDLVVKDAAVGDNYDGIEDVFQRPTGDLTPDADELVGEPGDGVGLAAAGGVLDEVALPRPVGLDVGEGLADDAQLVVAGPDRAARFAAGDGVLFLDDLGVIFEDVGEAGGGEDFLPEVVGFEALGVGRVARAVVAPFVEGQEPGGFALQFGAKVDFEVIDGEVDGAAAKGEEGFAVVAVLFVLLDGVADVLFGEIVFEFEGGEREAVEEQAEVEFAARLVLAVGELAGDGEAVERVQGLGFGVALGGGAEEEAEVEGAVVDAEAQDVNDAAAGDFRGEAGEEFEATDVLRVGGIGEGEFVEGVGLGGEEEGEDLGDVEGVGAVEVFGTAGEVADTGGIGGRRGGGGRDVQTVEAGEVADDEGFETLFGGVGCHAASSSGTSRSSVSSMSSMASGRASSGSCAAAWRTSSLPVTTSAIRRVRYSRRSSISRSRRDMARSRPDCSDAKAAMISRCSCAGGSATWIAPSLSL